MPHTFQGDKEYHIHCRKGALAEYLLVPGDPDRVPKIANAGILLRKIRNIGNFAVSPQI